MKAQSDQQQNAQSADGCQCMRPCLGQVDGGECALAAVTATSQATACSVLVCALLFVYRSRYTFPVQQARPHASNKVIQCPKGFSAHAVSSRIIYYYI